MKKFFNFRFYFLFFPFKIFAYQLDFLIPGISPRLAISLKQIRHNPKSLM